MRGAILVLLAAITFALGGSTSGLAPIGVFGWTDFSVPSVVPVPPSSSSLNTPFGVFFDQDQVIWIADTLNNRVLGWTVGGTAQASLVIGQQGSFSSRTAFSVPISADTMSSPKFVVATRAQVYVSDSGFHRVLVFSKVTNLSLLAVDVIGQQDFASGSLQGVSSSTLNAPAGLAVDSVGGVYVADAENHRVLYFASQSRIASLVYGQINFGSSQPNQGFPLPSVSTLHSPQGLALDGSENLYVCDSLNNRILVFRKGTSQSAFRVFGQLGSFSGGSAIGCNADSLNLPQDISFDVSTNAMFVADSNSNRLLRFAVSSLQSSAAAVVGQSLFTNCASPSNQTADTLFQPRGVSVGTRQVLVSDSNNHRIMQYSFFSTCPIGAACSCPSLSFCSAIGNVTISGISPLFLSLSSVLSLQGSVTSTGNETTIVLDLSSFSSSASIPSASLLDASDFIVLSGSLVVSFSATATSRPSTVQIPVLRAASVTGVLQSAYSNDPSCSVSPLYTPSTMSVVIQCTSNNLSTGAIVGIVVGAVVGGIIVAVAIIVITRYLRARYTEKANMDIKARSFLP